MEGSEALNQNSEPIPHLVIRDDYFHHESSVFPPNKHQDFAVDVESESPSPSPATSEASSESSEGTAVSELRSRAVAEAKRCCEILKAKVISGISRFGSSAATLCSVLPVTAMASLLLLFLFCFKMKMKMRLPWRRPTLAVRRDNQDPLLLLIKDKDEKISQLLLQIAQMNETLSARRKVPVVRIK